MLYSFCVLAALPVLLSFRLTSRSQYRVARGGTSSLSAGIDVSGLTFVPIPEEFNFDAVSSSSGGGTLSDLSNALIIAGGLAYFAYDRRPRGSARDDLIEIRKSKVPGGNLGVFSKKYIAEGTAIGSFPGFLMSADDALASKEDDKARASARKYFFVLTDDEVIDPTNKAGLLDLEISFLGGLIKVDTMLGRANEPPRGTSVNVFTRLNGPDCTVVADRDIFPDEEIFMDCGRYDRTNYDKEQEEAEAKRLAKIRLEEEEMMTLRPITADKTGGKVVYDQDTSLPDGFLRKLGKQDEKKFKKVGILSPEEGAGMFADLGNNMFGNKEDRDLIESLTGRDQEGQREKESRGKNGVAVSFNKEGDDEDLLESLRSQLGAKNLADMSSIPDILNPTGESKTPKPVPTPTPSRKGTGAPVQGPSIFDTRADPTVRSANPPVSAPASPSSVSSAMSDFTRAPAPLIPAAPKAPSDLFETPTPNPTPLYGPALTTKEAETLTDSLDDMTDDEVAAVLSKLRAAVSDRIKEEVSDAMMASGISRKNSMPSEGGDEGPKKMPRAQSVNPEVREKYEKELSAIEDELEKIYSDPLGTWQEMMANPEKFLEENEIGELSGNSDN